MVKWKRAITSKNYQFKEGGLHYTKLISFV